MLVKKVADGFCDRMGIEWDIYIPVGAIGTILKRSEQYPDMVRVLFPGYGETEVVFSDNFMEWNDVIEYHGTINYPERYKHTLFDLANDELPAPPRNQGGESSSDKGGSDG